jgi:hypothetical protein
MKFFQLVWLIDEKKIKNAPEKEMAMMLDIVWL